MNCDLMRKNSTNFSYGMILEKLWGKTPHQFAWLQRIMLAAAAIARRICP